jgi:F-type H+-transporting ATPase subunit b
LGLALAIATFLPAALAQESHEPPKAGEPAKEHETSGHSGEAEHAGMELWKWANFLILAGGLGYLAAKNAGPFFATRSSQIRKDMIEAQEAKREADARAGEVDRRLAALESDIAALRADSEREAQAETERLARHAAAEIAKIQANAEQEIVSAGKAARTELKRYSAELAINLAEQRLRGRMTPELQQALVRGFVRDLEPPSKNAVT